MLEPTALSLEAPVKVQTFPLTTQRKMQFRYSFSYNFGEKLVSIAALLQTEKMHEVDAYSTTSSGSAKNQHSCLRAEAEIKLHLDKTSSVKSISKWAF